MAEQKVILIVDDDYELSDGIRAVLETQGHKVIQARDGQQGQQMIYNNRPDLVILDMMMPRKGGYPVLEHFRDKASAPPIIMITANEGSRQLKFFGGFWAFPGGKLASQDVEIADGSSDATPSMQAHRVVACRELFEETGVLIARRPDGSFPRPGPDLDACRHALLSEDA